MIIHFHTAGLFLLILLINGLHATDPEQCPIRRVVPPELLHVPISLGDLIDRITILEIKLSRFRDQKKLANVHAEWKELMAILEQCITMDPELNHLKKKLRTINEQMWQIEDDIRAKEAAQCFDKQFITLARHVYFTNDARCAVKRKINELTGSVLIEEKEYTKY